MRQEFLYAEKIWIQGKSKEINLQAVFSTSITKVASCQYRMHLTGATLFRIFINKEFIHYGPARGPHGYARIDELDITDYLKEGINTISIEVAGYNCPTYYTIQGESFICAEIFEDEKVIAYTGKDFKGKVHTDRVQKVGRYAFQRSFTEVWHLNEGYRAWQEGNFVEELLERVDVEIDFIPREVPYAKLEEKAISHLLDKGNTIPKKVEKLNKQVYDDPTFVCFEENKIEDTSYYQVQELAFESDHTVDSNKLKAHQYAVWHMDINNNGFIRTKIKVSKDAKLIILFDETIEDGKISPERWVSANVVRYDLKQAKEPYDLMSFETYGLKYIGYILLEGEVELQELSMIEYSTPKYRNMTLKCKDNKIQAIFEAAIETYRQNTLDVFMDCPTRERAGWLCDSYFTSQSAYLFAGNAKMEQVFLENFVRSKRFPGVPEGMLPMCYPADHLNGSFIPQWGMWYILELPEYLERNKEADKDYFKDLCYNLLNYFKPFLNEDGLLEKLQGWNFIEWSVANDWVQDVSYPTNMIYSKILKIIGKLYKDETLIGQSNQVKEEVIGQSFDGKFFRDHAIRKEDGNLEVLEDKSEVCQYYALFTGVAIREDKAFEGLVNVVLHTFGPERKENGKLKDIGHANAFIGNYLRAMILIQWGEYKQVMEETKQYYYKMAEETGTLWENDSTVASLNHGFASYMGVIIIQAIFGIRKVDYTDKYITVDRDGLADIEAKLTIQTPDGPIEATNRMGEVSVSVPGNYSVRTVS